LLPAPHSAEALKLLREYVPIRLDITTQRTLSQMELRATIDRSNSIQEALWQQAATVSAKDKGMVPTGLFVQALNEMIDSQETRLTALRNRLPNIVLIALYGVAVIAAAFTGYVGGLGARRSKLSVYIIGVLVSSVILLIQDLDRPDVGFIEVSQQSMIDAAASIPGYTE
jgi:hypothetical protein